MRASDNQEPIGRKKPSVKVARKWWRHLPGILAVIVIISCVIYELGLGTDPKIVIEQPASPKAATFLQASSVYEQAAQQLFKGSLTNRSKLTIDTTSIASRLQQHFSEIVNVSVVLPLLGHRPIIYLTPASAAILLQSQSSGTFVLNGTGVAMRQIVNASSLQSLKLPVVVDQSGLTITAGHVILPAAAINFIELLSAQLTAAHFSAQSLILPAASGELDAQLSGLPYFIKFNLYDNDTAKEQIGAFLATEQYLKGKSTVPSHYVDVRVPGRAYYQ